MRAVPCPRGPELSELSRRGRVTAVFVVLAMLLGFDLFVPLPRSGAVLTGLPAITDMAQVRIFEHGQFIAGGTVVDPHWALTVTHNFRRIHSTAYSLAFGVVSSADDPSDQSNRRRIDRIVLHPTLADVAMVHFADAVPSTVQIPQLAQAAPPRYTAARLYGWGPYGLVLNRETGLVIDPAARENAASLREENPRFAAHFPAGINPMVTNVRAVVGDSGSGVFDRNDVLLGVQTSQTLYRYVNGAGNLTGRTFPLAFQEPVWQFRDWISRTIAGEGPSDPDPPHDELKRRRLADDAPQGDRPMSLPPPMDPLPVWPVAWLSAETGPQGLVTVACPTVSGVTNTCTQEITGQLKEIIGNDDPVKIRVGSSGREVMAWCRTTDTLTSGAGPVPVVRVSFTNTDAAVAVAVAANPPPSGYGWYDVNPARVLVGGAAIDASALAPC